AEPADHGVPIVSLTPLASSSRLLCALICWLRDCLSGGRAMPVTIEALGIDRLSVRERLDLIEQIWDSLPEQVSPDEVPEWHLAELARRRADAEASANAGKP